MGLFKCFSNLGIYYKLVIVSSYFDQIQVPIFGEQNFDFVQNFEQNFDFEQNFESKPHRFKVHF